MPKCASSAIVRAIRDEGQLNAIGTPELKHTPYSSLERFIIPYLYDRFGLDRSDFTVLCLFREPISWLHSWFSYRSRRALRNPAHHHHCNYTGEMTFNDFAKAWLSDPRPRFANVGAQSRFVLSSDGSLGPDEIYRYEDIDHAVERIATITGRRVRLRKKGASPRTGDELEEGVRERLKRALAVDYEIYDRLG